ncbi:glycerate kinase [Anoxybacillus tengchongensis]|uniref:Glycerate kinase n=1 Tax=Anoxybacillus tengchongensis TaxID=576944 RepID=A0A7W9YNU5_9BACL|nr:glycerate kinase [Anoxybacillus tengchongensis]MBB6175599.1 glycerate kinase [Anoxybacillus tengchongensis]
MNVVIAPDSFKGSLLAGEVCTIIEEAFRCEYPEATVVAVPMADGGEGTMEAIVSAMNGSVQYVTVRDPLFETRQAAYGVVQDTAVIEVAQVIGLPLVPMERRNPLHTTTYGVGEMIMSALHAGYRRFVIGLGGSSTNDGGFGMLCALGATFTNDKGEPLPPIPSSLPHIAYVDMTSVDRRVYESEFLIACDVDNPLYGERGASYVFGPQKGANDETIRILDQWIHTYAQTIEQQIGRSYAHEQGAGAAGGLGFAFLLLGGKLISGAKLVGETVQLPEKMKCAHIVITGEGQSDEQTLYGKVPCYVGQLANEYDVPAFLLSGSLGDGFEKLYTYFVSCDAIATKPMTVEQCMQSAATLLYTKARNLARTFKRFS